MVVHQTIKRPQEFGRGETANASLTTQYSSVKFGGRFDGATRTGLRLLPWALTALAKHHGAQHWWPADQPFEMAIGAVLTQHTSWANAALALKALRQAQALLPARIIDLPQAKLEALICQSGTFRLKAHRLKALSHWWCEHASAPISDTKLRDNLLQVVGIGPETADCIALYAFGQPRFIADSYARRWLYRMGIYSEPPLYEEVRGDVEGCMLGGATEFGEVHALIVAHGKSHCKAKPICANCPIAAHCARNGLPEPT